MEGCDEESMNTLMDLQYNANKLHIEFHQKAVALRTKYEANLERIIKEMKNRNKKAKLNQSSNNKNYKNAQTETNFDSETKEEEEEEEEEEKSVVLTLSSDRKSSQPRNYKSVSSSRRSVSASDRNNSSQVSKQKNVFFQENSQNDDFYDEYNESSHIEDSFKESFKGTTTDEDTSKQRSSQRKSSSRQTKTSNNNNSEVAEIRSVSPKLNPVTKPEVPCFWLRVFLNCKYTKDRVQVADQAPLYNMTNLKVNSDLSHLESDNAYRFILEFYFRKNDYFTNSILTKEYFVQLGNNNKNNNSRTLGSNDTYVNCKGCQIIWKPGMNVTEPESRSKKLDKNAAKRSKKSFFNFFNPPEYWQDEASAVKHQKDIEEDYRFGLVLKEKVIPRAISYYLGEKIPKSSGSESVSIVSSSTLPKCHFRSA